MPADFCFHGYNLPDSESRDMIPAYVDQNRITLNVSGLKFETFTETLNKHPDTLLGCPDKRKHLYNPATDEYDLPRDRDCFDVILFYYQSKDGILAKPDSIELATFNKELEYYQIPVQTKDPYGLEDLDDTEDVEKKIADEIPIEPVKRRLWMLLEHPRSSPEAILFAYCAVFVILLSSVAFCIETIPALKVSHNLQFYNLTSQKTNVTVSYVHVKRHFDYWFVIEACCIGWFTVEYTLRVYSSKIVLNFLKSPMGLVDIFAILPFYLTLIIEGNATRAKILGVIRAIRLFRVLRVFKLSRYNTNLKILMLTICETLDQLKGLALCLFILIIVASSAVYYGEGGSTFSSIPAAFWWSVITMSTVGYGDVTPKTIIGRLIGSACAICGVILFTIPTPVLVSKFLKFHLRNINDEGENGDKIKILAENLKSLFLTVRKPR